MMLIMVGRCILKDADQEHWLLFQNPAHVIQAWKTSDVLPAIQEIEAWAEKQGQYAVGFLSYEAAPAFDRAMVVNTPGELPLAWFGLFNQPDVLLSDETTGQPILPGSMAETIPAASLNLDWQPSVDKQEYNAAIRKIKQHIADGDTYQVNYTFRLSTTLSGDPLPIFLYLLRSQNTPFAAYIETVGFAICSLSPELFFDLDGEVLTSRPMKGTADRGLQLADDQAQGEWLHRSEKNRAENVMIVDMLRNDMGKIAEIGSVKVPNLFVVERYPTVWQMTSTVTAKTKASFAEILAALFPCASITGAPKIRTMQIIASLESTARQVYTGCIGYYKPASAGTIVNKQRRAQFNVAIRTVIVNRQSGVAVYGVGGGIVWDSTSKGEYQECMLKARLLTQALPDFSLLESILWTPEDGYTLLPGHLKRLWESAVYFGIPVDLETIEAGLKDQARTYPGSPHKIRLILSKAGKSTVEAIPIERPAKPAKLRLELAKNPIDPANSFLYHKTTYRQIYDSALAHSPAADDVLLWNRDEEATETCFGNLVVKNEDQYYTPPVSCGLLPGIFREHLLANGEVKEKIIHLKELADCQQIYVVNSVRGWREAHLSI